MILNLQAPFWPHAPIHIFNHIGTYMVTGSTMHKEHFCKAETDLNFLQDLLIELAQKYGWFLEAWAIFSNHYHFLAQSPVDHPLCGNLSHIFTLHQQGILINSKPAKADKFGINIGTHK